VKRLTPIVVGEMQPLLCPDGKIRDGFLSGPKIDSGSLPQWAKRVIGNSAKVHFFEPKHGHDGFAEPLCSIGAVSVEWLFEPGNYPRCKVCERKRSLHIRRGRR